MNVVAKAGDESSAAAVAINTGATASEDLLYQARLNAEDWSGDVRSFQISRGKGKLPCAEVNVPAGQLCQNPTAKENSYYRSAAAAMKRAMAADSTYFNSERKVFTAANGSCVDFKWASLTQSQKDAFRAAGPDGTIASDEKAQARLNYIRGDQANAQEDANQQFQFRKRTNPLGDFINAAPVLVGAPPFYYQAGGYPAYKLDYKDRTPLIYAGANDGMLHAFNANDLKEAFAFVPPALMGLASDPRIGTATDPRGLHLLSDPAYGGGSAPHHSFVDGAIATGDVNFGSSEAGDWHTVIMGGLGLGAQALYALDVTQVNGGADAASQCQTSTSSDRLFRWQITDRPDTSASEANTWDPDLGYVFGRPAIVRIRGASGGDPIWVAIIGNGYNSTVNDGSRPAACDPANTAYNEDLCGQAVLYVIEIETGKIIKRGSTGEGRGKDPWHQTNDDPATVANESDAGLRRPNALGQVTVVATTVDGTDHDLVADVAYAGDLFGNVWRFDLTASGDTVPTRKLFTAKDPTGKTQPITSPIAVARHPTGEGTLVLFGTGVYLSRDDIDDMADNSVQSFYGIWDKGGGDQTLPVRPPTRTTSRTSPDNGTDTDPLRRQWFIQTDIAQTNAAGAVVTRGRTSSNNPIDWSSKQGWYIDFDIEQDANGANSGERMVTEPDVQGGRVTFVSLVSGSNPCAAQAYSWINALDLRNGGRLGLTPFDYNLDGSFGVADLLPASSGDRVVGTSVRLTPGGKSTGVYSSASSVTDGAGRVTNIVSTSDGDLALINAFDIQQWRVWQQLQ